MGEERIQIMKMVADKVISVEDAERLMRALDEGDRARSESSRADGRRGRRADPARGPMASALGGMGEALGSIGELVESTVSDAMEGVESELRWNEEGEDWPIGGLVLEEGERLVLRQLGRGGPARLTLLPGDGDRCTIEAGGELPQIRVRHSEHGTQLRWRAGALTVRVPATVSAVNVRTIGGGDLEVFDLRCPVDARVLGGRVEIGTRWPFDLRVTGGESVLRLTPGFHGGSRIASMGGPVNILPADGVSVRIDASTTGGEVRVDPAVGRMNRDGTRFHRRSVIDIGPASDDPAEIVARVMGGDVIVKREGG